MYSFLESIRNKPDHVKHSIVLMVSGFITLIIFAGWIVSVRTKFLSSLENGGNNSASVIDSFAEKEDELGNGILEVKNSIDSLFNKE